MKIITESPEHHFLTTLEKIKADAAGWLGMHFKLSRRVEHDDMVDKLDHIRGKIHKLGKEAETLARTLGERAADVPGALVYVFGDGDVVLLARSQNEATHKAMHMLYKEMAQQAGANMAAYSDLAKDIYNYQKLADAKLLGSYKMAAYNALADAARVASIPLRRQRRDDPLVFLVEDDRFTASYAANILNKDYEFVLAKTGEEAISGYIEHAPDILFLDIHLPGLNGLETLKAIRKADPDAYVVVLSVDTVEQNVVTATKLGAAGFLKKPFSKERILTIVKQSPFVKRSQSLSGNR